jgi:tripartite-type tricarboxylate transporter receptor subunit TctC
MHAVSVLKKALPRALAIGGIGLLGLGAGNAVAQKVDYSGKRILMTVPFAPGGGTDVYVRALQPFLEKHLPGQPTIIVLNVPGSRSIPGANRFEERATTDGTHAIAVSATTVGSFVFDRDKIKYKLDKWEPVILSPQGAVTYITPSVGVKTAADLKKILKTQLVFGGQAPIGSEARTIMPLDLLGLNVKYVWGMNRGPVRLAFERRELTINYDSMPGYLNSAIKLVKAGKAIPLYSMGITDNKGALIRDPNVPDLPHFGEVFEMVHGKKASGPGFDAWLSVNKMLTMANKGIFLPAGTPKPILDAWRKAFVDILKDPEFQKHAAKVIEGYPSFIGDDAKPIIKDATTFSPEAWAWLKQYFKKEHNVTLK